MLGICDILVQIRIFGSIPPSQQQQQYCSTRSYNSSRLRHSNNSIVALVQTTAVACTCTAYTVNVDDEYKSTPNFGMVKSCVI